MLQKLSDYTYLLKLCCFLIFAGNGIALLSGGNSLEVLFGEDSSVELVFGLMLLIPTIPLLLPTFIFEKARLHYILLPAALLLLITSSPSFIESGYLPEQLFEHGIKLLSPVLLFAAIQFSSFDEKKILLSVKVLIALTFIGHGMYAISVHFVPDGFIDMTTEILRITDSNAMVFLKVIGYIDIICAVLIFVNFPMKPVYIYLLFWGLATALARLVYGILINEGSAIDLVYWSANMLYRLPHGLLALLLIHSTRTKKEVLYS